jgi:16S rRNA (cytidine1402-2'-O)-methyltransferase
MNRQKSFKNNQPTLFLVTTPIGNLDDITFRAVQTLKDVDVIFCEDTRVSIKLLKHFEIDKPLKTYHDYNKVAQSQTILGHLSKGETVALISDAGMPLISDPGFHVSRDVIDAGYNVVSIPGPSALLTALSVSGLAPHPFLFFGFLDAKKTKREKQLQMLKQYTETLIFYESPHRIHKTIQSMYDVFGERYLVLARELTKQYEEILRGTTKTLLDVEDIKGEMVLVVEGYKEEETVPTISILEDVKQRMKNGLTSKEAIKQVAKERNITKNDVYITYHQNDKGRE